jgi:hypothetical protein
MQVFRFGSLIASLCVLGFVPVAAAEDYEESVPRFALELGAGGGGFPFVAGFVFPQIRIGYRLPVDKDRWEVNLAYSPELTALGNAPNFNSIGFRHYWGDSEPLQKFFALSAGIGVWAPKPSLMTFTPGQGVPFVQVGMGANWALNRHLGLLGVTSVNLPFFIQSEFAIRLSI